LNGEIGRAKSIQNNRCGERCGRGEINEWRGSNGGGEKEGNANGRETR